MLQTAPFTLGDPPLAGELRTSTDAVAFVILAHADGAEASGHRVTEVADRLHQRRIGTLRIDLLAAQESGQAALRDDVALLSRRLAQVVDALPAAVRELPLGLFAADAAAAAALMLAAERPAAVRAVVSRGGRPDLAASVLADVRAPTLLLIGDADADVLALNREAFARLRAHKRIDVVPRASHLFLEAGAMSAVAQRAADWFDEHLSARG